MFLYLYTFIVTFLYLAALPILAVASLRSKYREAIPARFWLRHNPPLKPYGIWFHVCSFGEARAVKPLIEAVPSEALRMTTTTQTGKSVIDTYMSQSRYLPFEPLLFWWMRPQKVLVVFEAELWYLLFALVKRQGATTILINARISERSFPKYRRFAFLYRRIFANIDTVFAQTDDDKKRLEALGARDVKVTGNIKLASLPQPTRTYGKPSETVVCAASTHAGEETIILEAFEAVKQREPDAVLLIVPRHPERFETVWRLVEQYGVRHGRSVKRFSTQGEICGADVVLIDTMGELVNCYAVSDVVVIGGSFVPVGGHNIAEAAQFGCRIVCGPHMFHQHDMMRAVKGVQACDAKRLSDVLVSWRSLSPTEIAVTSDMKPIIETIQKTYKKDIK